MSATDSLSTPHTPLVGKPIRQFICKVASRCNLDCDYCYVYHHADQRWTHQPKRMAVGTAAQLGRRIREHCEPQQLPSATVVLHGGEPLLAGISHLRQLCDAIRDNARPIDVDFGMQTNGVLFDDEARQFCLDYKVTVGLSLDGPATANDRHRLDHSGRSTFSSAEQSLAFLTRPPLQQYWSGFLSVVDLRDDPLEVYRFLASHNPRTIEFLLPLGNYEVPPPGKTHSLTDTPYADWLIAIFDEWWRAPGQTIVIRRFRDIIALMAGSTNVSEEWGLEPIGLAIIETNGSMEAVDTLKTTFSGASDLGLDLFSNSIQDLLKHPKVKVRQERWSQLCQACQSCPVVSVCGGGYYPDRYSRQNGFQNPSVYCADLSRLIHHIHDVVSRDLHDLKQRG